MGIRIIVLLACVLPYLGNAQVPTVFKGRNIDVLVFDFNTSGNEFGPSLVGDTLFYSGQFVGSANRKTVRDSELNKYFQINKIYWDKNGNAMGKPIFDARKSTRYHDGPLCFNPATGGYFITRSDFEDAEVKNVIFQKKLVDLKIDYYDPIKGKSNALRFDNGKYSMAHPTMSTNGDTLYFSSDMSGGYGGKDIYRTIFRYGKWTDPVNVGKSINSPSDELYPSLHKSGDFFFASNRTGGKGGLDIYASSIEREGEFSNPVLLGDSMNTEADDFGLTIADSGNYGFFASNRAGNGDDDLYQVMLDKSHRLISGMITDFYTHEVLPGVGLKILDENDLVLGTAVSGSDGSFKLEIPNTKGYRNIVAQKDFFEEQKVEILYRQENVELSMVGLYLLDCTVLDASDKKPINDFCIRNFDDGQLWESVDGTCTVAMKHNAVNPLRIEAAGYLRQRIEVPTKDLSYGLVLDTVLLYPHIPDKVFRLDNIYYEYDKWILTEASKRELDKLVSMLKENENIRVSLRSHTDSRGRDTYNMQLSQKRSMYCEQYIVNQGVSSTRIEIKGYGETQLLNGCDDSIPCSEEAHRLNRRTEIVLII